MTKQRRILQPPSCGPCCMALGPDRGPEREPMTTLGPPVPEQNYSAERAAPLSEALHRYWGYESFRPGQENIVRSIAAGRDACVVMPTGGGKSLCFQFLAVLVRRRTVVDCFRVILLFVPLLALKPLIAVTTLL